MTITAIAAHRLQIAATARCLPVRDGRSETVRKQGPQAPRRCDVAIPVTHRISTETMTGWAANKGGRVLGEIAVTVDRDFARFGSKAYAVNKINTVDVTYRHPYPRQATFGWGLLALMSLLVFAVSASLALALCAFLCFLAYRAWQRSKIVEYTLVLVTSSHSVQAIKSRDSAFIQDIRDRIERAMAGRLD